MICMIQGQSALRPEKKSWLTLEGKDDFLKGTKIKTHCCDQNAPDQLSLFHCSTLSYHMAYLHNVHLSSTSFHITGVILSLSHFNGSVAEAIVHEPKVGGSHFQFPQCLPIC